MTAIQDTRNISKSMDIPPKVIYQYDHHDNIPWDIHEYQPLRQYFDHIKIQNGRKYMAQKKGQKDLRYQTKRGFYMDYHLKVVGGLPAPSAYAIKDGMDQTENKKQSKKHKRDSKLRKFTYIQQIEEQQKNRKKPGVGAYSLNKTQKQIKEYWTKQSSRKRKIGPKRFFYEDFEQLSTQAPGAGNYNPHEPSSYVKLNKTNYKQMIDKHQKQEKKLLKRRRSETAPGTYRPVPVNVHDFERIELSDAVAKKKKRYSANGFGGSARFSYQKPTKIKIFQKRPQPGTYTTFIEWKGKKDENPRKKGWLRSLSTGFTQSIYNSKGNS